MRTLCLLLLPALACAQLQMTIKPGVPGESVIQIAPPLQQYTLSGLAYSAEQTSVATLIDGTRQVQPSTFHFRDAKGRTRTESMFSEYPLVQLLDPVAQVNYVLDPTAKTAYRFPATVKVHPFSGTPMPCSTSPASTRTSPDGMVSTSEDLGAKTINGVEACGMRMTFVTPADKGGKNTGDKNAGERITETWSSREPLNTLVRITSKDPNGRVSTSEVKNLSFVEPASSLFEVPPGYRVVDVSGTFTIPLPSRLPAAPTVRNFTALTGMPFSAETRLNDRALILNYRDSLGRTRRESVGTIEKKVEIMDAVAGYRYVLEPSSKTARRSPVTVTTKFASAADSPVRPQTTKGENWVDEYLGTKEIDGFETVGTRMTIVYPPGKMGGNDRPLKTVNEWWTSPKLGIPMWYRSDHPAAGTSVSAVKNVKFVEPDAALFRVPEGYQIVDAPQ